MYKTIMRGKLPLIQLILSGKISWILGNFPIPLLSLIVSRIKSCLKERLFQDCSSMMTSTPLSSGEEALVVQRWPSQPVHSLEVRSSLALTRPRWDKNKQCEIIYFISKILDYDARAESVFLLHLSPWVWQVTHHFDHSLRRILPHCKPGNYIDEHLN